MNYTKFNTFNKNRNIFLDLDGVLCNFDGAFRKLISEDKLISLFEDTHVQNDLGNSTFTKYGIKYGWVEAWKVIENYGPTFFSDLEWLPDGKKLWNYLNTNFTNLEILTGSPLFKVGGWAKVAKNEWCQKELGDVKVNHEIGRLKQNFIKSPNDILIDDAKRNVRNWKEAGSIAILHSSADETIKELKLLD